jgi:anthranilate synthase component 1
VPPKPDFRKFLELSRRGNLIPVYEEIPGDLETPVSCFLKIADGEHAFLLESVEGGNVQGRYSFLGADPALVLSIEGGRAAFRGPGGRVRRRSSPGDPLAELERLLARYRAVAVPGLPRFCGGAVGFMGYDCARFYEKIPVKRLRKTPFPDFFFMVAETLLVFDHVQRKIQIVANAHLGRGASPAAKRRAYDAALGRIEALRTRLASRAVPGPAPRPRPAGKLRVTSNFTRPAFERAVRRVKGHIRKGDVIQTVISQRFRMNVRAEPFDVYRALRSVNPSPYMFYLRCGPAHLVGSSPEVHVRCEDGRVTLRPIAGTRRRGRDEREDEALARELAADPKERAEHVMLVDLGRNDLGRVCRTGTVRVRQFMTIERYSHVMHLVSHVEGELAPKQGLYDVIRATFPAGTVTGAPKVRAMEIINGLEPERRGPYAGLVGYLGFNGNFDSCITIRTVLMRDGAAWVQAGAGIVADSDPGREWMETRNKARGVLAAVEMAERGTFL